MQFIIFLYFAQTCPTWTWRHFWPCRFCFLARDDFKYHPSIIAATNWQCQFGQMMHKSSVISGHICCQMKEDKLIFVTIKITFYKWFHFTGEINDNSCFFFFSGTHCISFQGEKDVWSLGVCCIEVHDWLLTCSHQYFFLQLTLNVLA